MFNVFYFFWMEEILIANFQNTDIVNYLVFILTNIFTLSEFYTKNETFEQSLQIYIPLDFTLTLNNYIIIISCLTTFDNIYRGTYKFSRSGLEFIFIVYIEISIPAIATTIISCWLLYTVYIMV